ncbi:unnamed protein product, partial [Didymodactylos carnosus]
MANPESSTTDFSYLFFRNGASFPINYKEIDNDHEMTNSKSLSSPSKLVDLCCIKIVKYDYLTLQACNSIPNELYFNLFRSALKYSNDDTSINILIAKFPYKIFRLENFVQEKLTSIEMLYSERLALQRTKQAIKYSVIIIPRFIDSIRKQINKKTNLRILDVTNFPVVELILRYIATHCRLAEKETRRNQLIDIFNKQHEQKYLKEENDTEINHNNDEMMLGEDEYDNKKLLNDGSENIDLTKSSSYPDDTVIIRFDCIIQDYRTYVELLSALQVSTTNIQLQICTIDMRCIGLALVSSFLDHVNKQFVQVLRVPYNVLTLNNLEFLLLRLPLLINLHTLDLSCNFIDFRLNNDILEQFCSCLKQLKLLKNLSLSGSPINFCSLYENDIQSLINTSTLHQYLHLDLGTNRLNRYMKQLLLLLMKQKQ